MKDVPHGIAITDSFAHLVTAVYLEPSYSCFIMRIAHKP